jgi:regulatory protein
VPVVTALRATRGGRIAVHIDDAYLCSISESLLARQRLFKGRELHDAEVDELREAASAERVMGDAHRLLGHRQRSTSELRRRLLDKEHTVQAVDEAIERLIADGLLDDEAFARAFVHDKRAAGGWGRGRLERELRRLGVPVAAVDAALAGDGGGEAEGEDDELARALAVLHRRPRPSPPYDGDKRRAFAALQRRGFASGVAYEALRRWIDASRAPLADDDARS